MKGTGRERVLWTALCAAVAGVFLVTLLTPLGYSPWLLYLVPLFATRMLPGHSAPLLLAGVITVLMLVGLRLSPAGVEPVYALVSRLLAAVAFWVIAAFLVSHERVTRERAALTEQERAARAETEARHRALAELLERITDGFVALDREWRYTYVNRKAGEMFGREPGSLIGKQIWSEFPEGVGQPFHRTYERALAEQRPLQLEAYYEPWDRWFENRIYPSPDGLSIYFQDISERKRAELAHAASERRLRAILDAEPECVKVIARDGRLLEVNASGLVMLEADEPGQVCGKQVLHLLMAAYHEPFQELIARAFRGERGTLVCEGVGLRGTHRWFEIHAAPLRDERGEIESALAISRDITEQRQAQERLRELNRELEARVRERTAQLADSNKDLEAFSYSVSHDLRAPLRAVSGFAEIVARRHRAALDEEGRRYVDNIVEASRRMDRLIEDLLGYARLGRRSVASSRVPLGSVLEGVVRDLEPTVRALGARVQIAAPAPVVRGNPTLLRQIFTNLLENALAYRKPGTTPHIAVAYLVDGATVVVHVSDDGIGIPPEHHERIFEVFQRLHSQEEHPGSGVGLASVRRAADLLGGSVWVESAPGEGSTFCVRLACWEDATKDVS